MVQIFETQLIMWSPQELSPEQIHRCMNTVSAYAFYFIVGDALVSGKNLSCVRMADGEKMLMDICNESDSEYIEVSPQFDEKWHKQFGIVGIPRKVLKERLMMAATGANYYSPSLSGVTMGNYNVDGFNKQKKYVDNYFAYIWFDELKQQLYQQAKHVCMIHGNPNTANALKSRAKKFLDVEVTWIQLTNWDQADNVIKQARQVDAPLTIFSAGPASKYIGPSIAFSGNIPKVTLDIGQAMDRWTLLSLYEADKKLQQV